MGVANQAKQALRVAERLRSRLGWPAVAALGLVLLLWLVLVAPALLVPARSAASLRDVRDPARRHELQDARLRLQNDVRTTLLQALGGAAVLTGAWAAWRQLHLLREGQITERFTRAIDHLGSDQLDIRLGGIYALERIALDSGCRKETCHQGQGEACLLRGLCAQADGGCGDQHGGAAAASEPAAGVGGVGAVLLVPL
jgi:hypothetical protein